MSEWIGTTAVSDTGWNHLETLVDIGNRMAGSDGERVAAEATRDALSSVGAREIRIDPFEIQGWRRDTARIQAGDTRQSAIALPRSPGGNVFGTLVDLGHGLPDDFERADIEGSIVIADSDVPDWYDRYIHRREKYYRAVAAGAKGFIYANHVEGCLPPTGSVGTPTAPIGEIPAVGVSKEVGARLRRRWKETEVSLELAVETDTAVSHNVHADLGPPTEEAIFLTGHLDAHDIAEGAMDNGAGTAMVIELAQALAARETELETRIHCVVYGAEEVGLIGSSHDAAERPHDTIKAVVNNDGVVRDRTLEFHTNGFPELGEAVDAVADRLGHPVTITPEMAPHSDHWPYVERGVPGYHVQSDTGTAERGWGHTAADTLDKLDRRDLREQAIFLTELVVELAKAETQIDHRNPEDIAAQLDAEEYGEGMRIIGDWPY